MNPDAGTIHEKPWSNRTRILPSRTYTGRIVYTRRKHYFTIDDVSRILDKIQPSDSTSDASSWISYVIQKLQDATIGMLERLLPFLDDRSIEYLYNFCLALIDKFLNLRTTESSPAHDARRLIVQIADRAGLKVTFSQ